METIAEESKKSPVFTKDEFKMALCNYRKIDVGKLEGRRKLIDAFVNSVFLYDDHLKIIYNGKEKEEVISLKELESSKLSQIGQTGGGVLHRLDAELSDRRFPFH